MRIENGLPQRISLVTFFGATKKVTETRSLRCAKPRPGGHSPAGQPYESHFRIFITPILADWRWAETFFRDLISFRFL
jgi:hypothetical protein